MRKFVSATRKAPLFLLTALIPLAAASAGDLGRGVYKGGYEPIDIWSGFYLGVNGGYGFNGDQSMLSMNGWASTEVPTPLGNCLNKPTNCTAALSNPGFGGGQIGFNVLRGSILLGLEADLQTASTMKAEVTSISNALAIPDRYSATAEHSLDWFGTVRGRLGMVYHDATLVYFTGGLASAGAKGRVTANLVDNDAVPAGEPAKPWSHSEPYSKTLTGYTIGGGFEHAFTPSWSLKAEYQYLNLGKASVPTFVTDPIAPATVGDETNTATANISNNLHTLRVGLNYHIHSGYSPLN